ncbi:uncharacterized protein BKCO1_1000181 [Diplodia corticola]|uniref:Uncharacterized protein n=1 Tax=Diplodia corticola TaxID=236234 RepID=A0A1J9SL50_9PEZI|nr:uncharacterized protein BKCO1_1000181 [Diplodia corticola]OJD40349.1 hypothetical protein BKCO1_1000181 [Diplodia corticola]
MVLFGRLKDTILGYLTPCGTPQRRGWLHRAPQAPATPTTPTTPSRNSNGKRPLSRASHHEPNKRRKLLGGVASYLTPPSSRLTNGPEELSSSFTQDSELNADTDEWHYINSVLAADDPKPLWTTPRNKNLLAHYPSPQFKGRSPKDTSSVQPDKPFDEADLKRFEREKARAQHAEHAQIMREGGFGEDPIKVYLKIAMRGWEAILPKPWTLSFDSFPRILFADDPKDEYIKALSGSQFRAMKALRLLVNTPARARDATLKEVTPPPSRQPEKLIRRAIDGYMKWAFADAGVSDVTPTLALLSVPADVEPEVVEERMTRRLTKLKQEWRENLAIGEETDAGGNVVAVEQLCAPPTIYGILASHLMVSFVVLQDEDDGHERPGAHQLFCKHMDNIDYDIWDTIAIAIVVMHCRTKMANLKGVMDDYDKEVQDQCPQHR